MFVIYVDKNIVNIVLGQKNFHVISMCLKLDYNRLGCKRKIDTWVATYCRHTFDLYIRIYDNM